jgi:uncharacterized protein YbaP (TraB family)
MENQKNLFRCLTQCGALASLLLLSFGQPLHGEEELKHPVKPLLWEISGNGLSEPSYLFGTIHLGDPRLTTLHPAAQKAFDSADSVWTEVLLDQASQMAIMPMLIRKDGESLNESIGGELAKRLNEELKLINPALDSKGLQSLTTWAVAMTLPVLPEQMDGRKSLDQELWDAATRDGKKTGAIETLKSQMDLFANLSEEEQVIVLSETMRVLKKDRDEGRNSIATLKEAYISGEVGKVTEEMDRGFAEMADSEHKELGERMIKSFLTDRDKSMAESIAEKLKKESYTVHFFAAGAAHFSSETSIRSHLEKAGYEITRIEQ